MTKTIKLDEKKIAVEKAVVIKINQSKSIGDVLKLKNHIRYQHHLNTSKIYCDFEEMEIHVFGAKYNVVKQVVEGFARGLSTAGHGGYRISFQTEEREIDIEESIRKDERLKIKEEMIDKNNEKTELEQKWSNDRKSYEENIEDLQLTKKRNENDIKKLNKNYDDLENEKDIIQNELNTYHIPAYKIVWRRFKELVGK